MSAPTFARRERDALCDTALEVGPDAPTLCEGWTARDLVAHLLVRERNLVASAGMVLPFLASRTEQTMAKVKAEDYEALVARLRDPGRSVVAVSAIDRAMNTLEFYVHHEDLRRAQPTWKPRPLDRADESAVWRDLTFTGRLAVRKSGVPTVVRRSDTAEVAVLRKGEQPVTVVGLPSELILWLFGRQQFRDLVFDGPQDSVDRLRAAQLGI